MGKDANLNGVFKWLRNRDHDVEIAKRILNDYAKHNELMIKAPKRVAEVIQNDFSSFVEWYKKNKNKYPRFEKIETYDEWWSRKNLDGSFAYNGVTDDF
jgi:hypothetical protein